MKKGDQMKGRDGKRVESGSKPGGIEQRLEPAALAFKIQTWQRLPALSCSTGAIIPPARSIYTGRLLCPGESIIKNSCSLASKQSSTERNPLEAEYHLSFHNLEHGHLDPVMVSRG